MVTRETAKNLAVADRKDELYTFFKGDFIPLRDAKVGIMTHALHYGTGAFEGIRGNWNEESGAVYIFRLREHYERLLEGCQLLLINIPYSVEDLCEITTKLVKLNGHREDIYIRPLAYKSAEVVANQRLQDLDSDFALMSVPFGDYLGKETLNCCTSSWVRVDHTMMPSRLKICGVYINSVLAKTEATLAGYDEAILLNQDGHVCEGASENIFIVTNGQLITPPLEENVLPGITRDAVLQLARNEMGLEAVERTIERGELYTAQEVFLTGTAAHLTPVVQLDSHTIANGLPGPITAKLQQIYLNIISGRNPDYLHWCTPVIPGPVTA